MQTSKILGLLVLGNVVLVACNDGSENTPTLTPSEKVADRSNALINGIPDNNNTYGAVVSLPWSGCSGVLVGRRAVLMASHCLPQPQAWSAGCWSPDLLNNPLPVRFSETDGSVRTNPDGTIDQARVEQRKRFASAVRVMPGAAYNVTACPVQTSCTPNGTTRLSCFDLLNNCPNQQNVIDRSQDAVILYLNQDAPADVRPLPMLVAPGYDVPNGFVFAGIDAWFDQRIQQGAAPYVTTVGYGAGTQVYGPAGSALPGRDMGITRWRRRISEFKGATTWTSCTTKPSPAPSFPAIFMVADDITCNTVSPSNPEACDENGAWYGAITPNQSFPAQQSLVGGGDSGGPVILGRRSTNGTTSSPLTPTINGLNNTSLPAIVAPGDTYDPNQHYVAAIGGAAYTVWFNSPGVSFWPTYRPSVTQFLASALADADKDGIPNEIDICNGYDDGVDLDNDGIPDGCDECNSAINDDDKDGFCGDGTPGTGPDNCPTTIQTSIANTNLDFEQVLTPTKQWGDACDPVPTLRHKPSFQVEQLGGETFQNEFTLQARASHKAPDLLTSTSCAGKYCNDSQTKPANGSGVVIPSHFRWCDRMNFPGADCMAPPVLMNQTAAVRLPPLDAAGEESSDLYHRIRFRDISAGVSDTFGRDKSISPWYNDAALSNRIAWDRAQDLADWRAAGFFQANVTASYNLHGNTWFHTEANIGKDSNNTQFAGLEVGWHGAGLANAVVAFNTAPVSPAIQLPPIGPGQVAINWLSVYASKLFEISACIMCMPMLRDLGFDDGAFLTNDVTHGPLLVRDDGTLRPVGQHLGANLKTSLNDSSLTWVAGAEPDFAMGQTDILAVALSAAGNTISQEASYQNNGLAGKGDRLQPQFMTMSTLAEGRLPARSGWKAAFSRSLRRVFLVGGTLQGQSTPSGELWSFDLGSRRWSRLVYENFAPQTVLAATYSFADKSVYVVDQTTGTSPQRRLVRLPVGSHQAVILGSWATMGNHDQVWLESDRRGDGVLLSCSSSTSSNHTIVNVSTRLETATVLEKVDGTGKLGVGLSAHPGGYLRLKRGSGDVPVIDRAASLANLAGTYTANPVGGLSMVGTCLQ